MKQKSSKEIYDHLWKDIWEELTKFGPGIKTRFRLMKKMVLKYKVKDNILDIGCGDGSFLAILKSLGYEKLYGSDISPESLKLAQHNEIEDVYLLDFNSSDFNLDKKFDTIICSEVLEHIENDELAIQNIEKISNKKAKVIISVPYSMKYWSMHDKQSGHYRRYERNELEQKLMKHNFSILKSFIWGAGIYALYYKIIMNQKPSELNFKKNKKLKIFISKILYYIFILDDFIPLKNGRRIFIVAQYNG